MYLVVWCGHDGNRRELHVSSLEDAAYEALKLRHRFDGVDIVDPETGEPLALM